MMIGGLRENRKGPYIVVLYLFYTAHCAWLLGAIIYNFYKGSIGVSATWQEVWMLVGSGVNIVGVRLGKGQGGAHL